MTRHGYHGARPHPRLRDQHPFYSRGPEPHSLSTVLHAFRYHFCAPVFSFLAGTGSFLATSRGKSVQQVSWFLVYGRVPLFYYVLHLCPIHVAILVALLTHQPAAWLWHGAIFLLPTPQTYGHSLPFIYAIWTLVVAGLYIPCGWFMDFKARHRDWNWLSYL